MPNENKVEVELLLRYDVPASESLSEGVIAAVSAASNASPIPEAHADAADGERTLDPLYTAIDPEALDSVFRTTGDDADRTRGRVAFQYHGYEVTVHSDERISVSLPAGQPTGGVASSDVGARPRRSSSANGAAASVESNGAGGGTPGDSDR